MAIVQMVEPEAKPPVVLPLPECVKECVGGRVPLDLAAKQNDRNASAVHRVELCEIPRHSTHEQAPFIATAAFP